MPRGYPDYGVTEQFGKLLMPTDIAELAARLNSIVTYDRRGEVVDFDDFEEPVLRWNKDLSNAANAIFLHFADTRSGSQALHLETVAGLGEYSLINKTVPILVFKRVGVEMSFAYPSAAPLIQIKLTYYDGTYLHNAEFWVDRAGKKLYILDDSGTDIEVADTGSIFAIRYSFHTIKLVVDFETDEYVRVLFNNNEYDVSATSFASSLSGIAPGIKIELGIENSIALGTQDLAIDNYILTQDEP